MRTLGFTKLNQSIVHKNILPIRGMINTVPRPLLSLVFILVFTMILYFLLVFINFFTQRRLFEHLIRRELT